MFPSEIIGPTFANPWIPFLKNTSATTPRRLAPSLVFVK